MKRTFFVLSQREGPGEGRQTQFAILTYLLSVKVRLARSAGLEDCLWLSGRSKRHPYQKRLRREQEPCENMVRSKKSRQMTVREGV